MLFTKGDIVLHTHNDLDATGCAVVFSHMLGIPLEQLEVSYWSYGGLQWMMKRIMSKDPTYVVLGDLSLRGSIANQLDQWRRAKPERRLICFDHHESTRDAAKKYDWIVLNEDNCGARVMLENFGKTLEEWAPEEGYHLKPIDSDVQLFIAFVDAWDAWKLDSPFRSVGEHLTRLMNIVHVEEMLELVLGGTELINPLIYDKTLIQALVGGEKRDIKRSERGVRYYSVAHNDPSFNVLGTSLRIAICYGGNIPNSYSLFADYLFKIHKNLDIVLVVWTFSGSASIRSPHINVATIAEKCGGGGHPNAAGLKFPKDIDVVFGNKQEEAEQAMLRFIFTAADKIDKIK